MPFLKGGIFAADAKRKQWNRKEAVRDREAQAIQEFTTIPRSSEFFDASVEIQNVDDVHCQQPAADGKWGQLNRKASNFSALLCRHVDEL